MTFLRQPQNDAEIPCRPDCGACCTAPSISSAIPGMPQGKPAGIPCVQLDERRRCRLFGDPGRPQVCRSLLPRQSMCGVDAVMAMAYLGALEASTTP
ncbi:MAG: YkgJ family cysteine cluster protein [Alcanivoracaceae bacterium]